MNSIPRSKFSSVIAWFDSEADNGNRGQGIAWLRVIPFILLHLACLAVFWVGYSHAALIAMIAAYSVRMFAIFPIKPLKPGSGWNPSLPSSAQPAPNAVRSGGPLIIGNTIAIRIPKRICTALDMAS
jgi:hypothetical protein